MYHVKVDVRERGLGKESYEPQVTLTWQHGRVEVGKIQSIRFLFPSEWPLEFLITILIGNFLSLHHEYFLLPDGNNISSQLRPIALFGSLKSCVMDDLFRVFVFLAALTDGSAF